MKLSPTPWHTGPYNARFIFAHDGGLVAECARGDEQEDLANARLIAAAPEMIEALKELYDAVNHPDWISRWATGENLVVMNKVRAAISKATRS